MHYYLIDNTFHSSDELYHHGVKGMKWGVRKKSYYNVSGKRSKRESQTDEEYAKIKREKVKKAVKIGAAVAGTALAVYGGYKLSQYAKNKKASVKLVNDMLQKPLSMSKVASGTENGKNAVKTMMGNAVKSADVPKAAMPKATVPITTIPKATVNRSPVQTSTVNTVKKGTASVDSMMSSYGNYSWDSLKKANSDLLNQSLDDLLKGL